MPDHLRTMWLGIRVLADQLPAMKHFRTWFNEVLRVFDCALQEQAYENVLKEDQRIEDAFTEVCEYIARNTKLDDERTGLYFAPRKNGSGWSALNQSRVETLLREGLLMPAGLAKIEAAKEDGTWSKLDDIESLAIPDDLCSAMACYPNATKYFNAFPKSVKRGILEWILNAKRADTRQKRIAETTRLAEVNERANQWKC